MEPKQLIVTYYLKRPGSKYVIPIKYGIQVIHLHIGLNKEIVMITEIDLN